MKKFGFRTLILVLLALLLMPGCSPMATEEAEEPTEAPESTTEYADEIVIGIGRDLYYGNAQWHMIHGSLHVWEPLVYPDQIGRAHV